MTESQRATTTPGVFEDSDALGSVIQLRFFRLWLLFLLCLVPIVFLMWLEGFPSLEPLMLVVLLVMWAVWSCVAAAVMRYANELHVTGSGLRLSFPLWPEVKWNEIDMLRSAFPLVFRIAGPRLAGPFFKSFVILPHDWLLRNPEDLRTAIRQFAPEGNILRKHYLKVGQGQT